MSIYVHTYIQYVPSLSTAVWSQWDQLVRQWTTTYGTIHVIVGSVLDSNSDGIRDRDEDYDRYSCKMCILIYSLISKVGICIAWVSFILHIEKNA